jgi:hypothetical protein
VRVLAREAEFRERTKEKVRTMSAGVGVTEKTYRRAAVRTGGGVVAALALVVVLVGSASGAPALAGAGPVTKTWTAPYTASQFGILIASLGGCSSVGLQVSPFFNVTSGLAYVSDNASARSCPGTNSTVFWEMDAVLESAAFTTTTGVHHVKASWSLNFVVDLAAHRGKTSQNATASYELAASLELVDLTTDTDVIGNITNALFTHTIYTGTYSHTYLKDPVTSYFNGTLSKKDRYAFEAYVFNDLDVSVTPGSSSASASVNLGSAGNDAVLKSVTMS